MVMLLRVLLKKNGWLKLKIKKKRKKKKRRRGIVMVDLVYAKRLLVDDKEFVCVSVYLEYII